MTPTVDQIARFLQAFDILASFDVQSRAVRGYGAGFDPVGWPETPDPAIIAVLEWLKALADAA